MSSVGVTITYFYTSFTAYSLFKWKKDQNFDESKHVVVPWQKAFSFLGILLSLVFLLLLIVPGSPAFLGTQSRLALVAWILLSSIFYIVKRKEIYSVPQKEMNFLILGEEEIILKK